MFKFVVSELFSTYVSYVLLLYSSNVSYVLQFRCGRKCFVYVDVVFEIRSYVFDYVC